MKIRNRKIGDSEPPLVIAEIGINHGGCLEVAKKLVKDAVLAGAEVIKHQTHFIEDEMSSAAGLVIPGNADKSILEIMDQCALTAQEEEQLKNYTESLGAIYISTPFSRAAADFLHELDVPAFKVGSGECNNIPLLKHIASFGKPMIISTGMNTLSSVADTVEVVKSFGIEFALLHTTNLYPTPSELVRLGAMLEMKKAFPTIEVGLSDHTTSNLACFAAVALGANILERHFTDTKERAGPDIINSMDPTELRELKEGALEIQKMRGGAKEPAKEEQVTIDFAFASVVTIKAIRAGEIFDQNNIWVKRPGVAGIPAKDFENVLGKKARRNFFADEHVEWCDVS